MANSSYFPKMRSNSLDYFLLIADIRFRMSRAIHKTTMLLHVNFLPIRYLHRPFTSNFKPMDANKLEIFLIPSDVFNYIKIQTIKRLWSQVFWWFNICPNPRSSYGGGVGDYASLINSPFVWMRYNLTIEKNRTI